ncbi:MAG: GNVR domain-containing protein [Pseudomonadota bacterium]
MTQKTARLAALAEGFDRPHPDAAPLDILLILRRQKWPLVFGAVLGLALAVLHYVTSPKTYYAASNILISEQTNSPQDQLTASVPVLRNETTVLNEMQVLRSLDLAERVVERLSLDQREGFLTPPVSAARQAIDTVKSGVKSLMPIAETAPFTEVDAEASTFLATALTLQKDLGLQRVGRTFAIEISFIHDDPELAAAIVNAYAETYLEDRQLANRANAALSAEWLRDHIDEVHARANDAAAEAEAFRLNNGASNVQALRLLELRASSLTELHTSLLTRYEMIAIEGSSPVANGRILSAGVAPTLPALPKAWRVLAVGLVFGLMCGMALATWREMRETACREGRELRELTGLPFLGYLDRFKPSRLPKLLKQFSQSMARGKGSTLFRWLPGVEAGEEPRENHIEIRNCTASFLLPAIAPNTPYSETIKNVRATIDLTAARDTCQVIALGSLDHQEGRSTVAANLAQLAALEGQQSLLIDADLSNPELSHHFGFRYEAGLHDVIEGRIPLDHAIFKLPETGLHILPGRLRRSQSRINTVCKLSQVLDQARPHFDTIVIDFQPLATCSDLKSNLPYIDAVVLLALWGKTSKQSFKQFVENEPQLRAKTAGVLLNKTVARKLPLYGASEADTIRRKHVGFA